jgi:hypothetical protein
MAVLLHRFAGIDGGTAFIVHQVARHQVPPVGGSVKDRIGGAAFDAALQRRLERLVAGIVLVEGKVVAEQDHPARTGAQDAQQSGQGVDILAMNLDQHQSIGAFARLVDLFMHRLDQAGLSHAARAPQQRIVGGQPLREMPRVGEQGVALVLHALEQAKIDMGNMRHRDQSALPRLPDKGIAIRQSLGDRGGGEPFQRIRDPSQ